MTSNKSIKSIVMVCVMIISLLGFSISASAAESYHHPYLITSTRYQTIASSTTGFNRNVKVFNSSTSTDGLGILRADIRMLDKYGNVVWEEKKLAQDMEVGFFGADQMYIKYK